MAIALDTASNTFASGGGAQSLPVLIGAVNTGTIYPSSGTDDSTIGTLVWANPGRITSPDLSRATTTLSGTTISHYLLGTSFGFSIPAGATITGIQVEIAHFRNGGTTGQIRDNSVRLQKGGVYTGNDYAQTSTNWAASQSYFTYGGPTDLWGTTWAYTDINASNFGAGISVKGSAAGADRVANVDAMRITVYYVTSGMTLPNSVVVLNLGIGNTGGVYPTSVTMDGVTISAVISNSNTTVNNGAALTYVVTGLSPGSHTLVVTNSGATNCLLVYSSWTGVDQTTPVDTTYSTSITGTTASGSVTTTYSNEVVIDFMSGGNAAVGFAVGSQIELALESDFGPSGNSSYVSASTITSYSMSQTASVSSGYLYHILALAPASTGTVNSNFFNFM